MEEGQIPTNKRVYGYVRVSTGLQASQGTPENQRRSITDYAKRNNLTIVKWFEDAGISGASSDRPALRSMLEALPDADGIIVYDADRLVRDEELGTQIMFTMMRQDKRLYSVRGGESDFNNATDRLMYFIKVWAASDEKRKINERQLQGIARYREKHAGAWGRRALTADWRSYDRWRKKGLSNAACAKLLGMSPRTLKRRLQERSSS